MGVSCSPSSAVGSPPLLGLTLTLTLALALPLILTRALNLTLIPTPLLRLGGLSAALRDAHGSRVKQPNKLRRWLAKLLANTRGVIFSGHKSDEYVEELDTSRSCIILTLILTVT